MPTLEQAPALWTYVVGPVTGAVIASVTAWITNKANDRRELQRLVHDGQQKDLDRKLAIKRDIYLNALGELGRFEYSINKLLDYKIESVATSLGLENLESCIKKLTVVAPLPLYRAVLEFGQLARIELHPLVTEHAKYKVLSTMLADAAKSPDEHSPKDREDLAKAQNELMHRSFKFCESCMKAHVRLKRKALPIVREMRRELDTSINMKELEQLQEDDLRHLEATLFNTLSKMQDELVKA